MTNSEEPSAPDGISSMKVSETFGTQHNQLHHHHNNFGNYANGDLKGSNSSGNSSSNGTTTQACALAPPPVCGTNNGAAAYASSSSSSSSSSNNHHEQPDNCNHYHHQHHHLVANSNSDPPPPLITVAPATSQLPALPFALICGEELEYKTEVSDGNLVLTNYRLFLQTKEATYNLPLGLLEGVECRDIFFLHINCKDARCVRCTFPNNEATLDMLKRIQSAISPTKKVDDNFSFTFYKKTKEGVSEEVKSHLGWDLPEFPSPKERFDAEVKRMEFNVQGPWRVSDENKDYELCNSYPTHIIVPCVMDKKKLEQVACFRSQGRIPAVVWRHKGNGAVISRCSQPEVGWFGWRSNEDEELVQNIVLACADNGRVVPSESQQLKNEPKTSSPVFDNSYGGEYSSSSEGPPSPGSNGCNSLSSMEVVPEPPNIKKLLILDARSYSTAVVNRARGGGCECLEYYTNCEIQFMNLANIHSIRKSFINVRQLCSGTTTDQVNNNWFSQLESCKWLQHMSGLMKAAVTVGTAIEHEARPVMVHCSDGWDRTPQIVALAEILLDPYYRSLEGFQVLIEREWLDFGHKFADRCGQGVGSEDANERCPVFLQWLDCLHQLINQFPTAFEFNLTFLIKLAQHTYSNLFGTFLCNTAKERLALNVYSSTHSIWRFLRAPANYGQFRNHLYSNCDQVLWPSCEVRELKLWTQVYLGFDNSTPVLTEVINPSQESSPAPSVAESETSDTVSNYKLDQSKGRSSSCENLHFPHAGTLQRRNSDPSLSDSVLDIDSTEEVEIRCLPQTEKMLTAASRDIDRNRTASTNSDSNASSVSKEMTTFAIADTEDFSENEDTETNSEEKSESTVVNLKYLKSIESSTDTLVAEMGVTHESSVGIGIQRFVMDVNNKTERDVLDSVRADILRKTEAERLLDNTNHEKEIEETTAKLRYLCDTSSLLYTDKSGIKDLVQPGSDLDQIIGNQQCEVCATSRKLLSDDVPTTNPNGVVSNGSITTLNGTIANNTTTTTTNNLASVQTTLQTSSSINSLGNNASNGSKYSSHNTPLHSRTPSTGIPVPPEESYFFGKPVAGERFINHHYHHQYHHFDIPSTRLGTHDVDGLEPLHDQVQSRLHTIITGYRGKIDILQRELQMYRDALKKQVCHQCTHHMVDRQDDVISVVDSLCSVEHQSVGHESHSSWEAVDERDTRPPLWLPDYAVTRCMGCEATFWLGKRKHHCRSCGKIFCADCSEHAITIPSEQLFTPVRVCSTCFYQLSSLNHGMSSSSPASSSSSNTNPASVKSNGHHLNGSSYLHANHHASTFTNQNGLNHHRGSMSEYTLSPDSVSPSSSRNYRRMSDELPRKHQQQFPVCNGNSGNGMKFKSKQQILNLTPNEYPHVGNGIDDSRVCESSNGHLSYQ